MGKKPAKGNGAVTLIEKFDYENYIRFGYRLPHGLVVTRVNAQIGGEDGIPLPVSFIDRAPVCMNGAINFDHLHDVLIFAIEEKVDRDLKRVLAEQAKQQDLESLGECRCDGCENNLTGSDCKADPFPFDADEVEPYLDSKGQMIYPECDHLNGYCKGEDQCTEPGFPGRAE